MKTKQATAARRENYEAAVLLALPIIQSARASGIKKSSDFADSLNSHGVPAPNKGRWNADSVLHCLSHLKAHGLDRGSLPHGQARNYQQPRKRRFHKAPESINWSIPAEDKKRLEEQFSNSSDMDCTA
jgi:hypothetical protein